jgi:putative ABC transport system substrate-binding protein
MIAGARHQAKSNCKVAMAFVLLFALCFSAAAQPSAKTLRIGYLVAGYRSDILARTDAFRQGLRELGYEEGKNIVIEQRYAKGKIDRLSQLAAELVRLNVKVIVAAGPQTTSRANQSDHPFWQNRSSSRVPR